MRFVLRRLSALPAGPRADRGRVAAIGHSLGGATAAALMRAEPAIRAGVDMDGSMIGTGRRGVARPFLIMAGWRGLDPTLRTFLRNSRGPLLALRFRGLEHMSFSDLPAIAPTAILGARRPPSRRDVTVQRTYLRAFLDRYVRDRRSRLLDGPSDRRPDVRIAYRARCCG